ncbi:M48 family metalloprotease [bacterium]|nr:M48 family metalloprotease [bacterium]
MNPSPLIGIWAVWAWGALWQVTFLFALVLVANRLLRGFPARFRHTLYLLVFAKLLVTPSLTAPWSLGSALVPGSEPTDSWLALFSDPIRGAHTLDIFDPSVGVEGNPCFWNALAIPQSYAIPVTTVCFGIWLIGMSGFFATMLAGQWELWRAINKGRTVTTGPLLAEFRSCAAELGIRVLPRLVLLGDAATPFLCGFRTPTVVLPAELPGMVERDQLRAILLHELMHLKRRDLEVSWFVSVLQCIFWFHPAVWLTGELLAEERELCVDEALVAGRRVEALRYCRTILDVCELASGPVQHAMGFLGPMRRVSEIERRIHNVLGLRRLSAGRLAFGWSFLVVFGLAFLPMGVGEQATGEYVPVSVVSTPI